MTSVLGRCGVTLLCILTYVLGFYVFMHVPLRHQLLALWAGTMCLYNFLRASWTTLTLPEIMPDLSTGEFRVAHPNEDVELYFTPRWCKACELWKPPRTHHCRTCKRCVLRMDHHCPFLFNCVGVGNHGHVFIMYVFAAVGTLHGLFVTFVYLPWDISVVAFQVLLATILGAVCLYGSVNVYLCCFNATVLEHMFAETRSPLTILLSEDEELPVHRHFFYASPFESVTRLLGPSWLWRLLLPIKGRSCDVDTLAIHPPCSRWCAKTLVQVLRQRGETSEPASESIME